MALNLAGCALRAKKKKKNKEMINVEFKFSRYLPPNFLRKNILDCIETASRLEY
jgi:hypothetical protein